MSEIVSNEGGEQHFKLRIGPEPFLDHAEEDKPRVYWWGITRGSLTYAASGHTSEEAYRNVADAIGISLDRLLTVPTFAELYPENVQADLTNRFGEQTAVRILRNSIVEWPQDFEHLTDEQLAHGIQFGWLNPDGTWPEQ